MKINKLTKQRVIIKFLVKLGKTSQEINEMFMEIMSLKIHLLLSGLSVLTRAVKTSNTM